jgi:hypothetical protein
MKYVRMPLADASPAALEKALAVLDALARRRQEGAAMAAPTPA